jgi:nucleoside-diphosphate-sugar epimerase
MKALVIGGTGYVGSAVVRALLDHGVEVVSLSRSGRAFAGDAVQGDVRLPDLGLAPGVAGELHATVTHVVSCFGSVDWDAGPRLAVELHRDGTRSVLRFARNCRSLERLVHLSSVLALGRARGPIVGELELGQAFRNWYEYGKHLAERELRAADDLPWRVVRVGPVVGPGGDVAPSTASGVLAAVPYLLRGYPVHLADGGSFPCYPCDAETAGRVIARAALDPGDGDVWTWFDDTMPSLADLMTRLCSAWLVVPRIVSLPALAPLGRLAARRLGLPPELLEYADPWTEIPLKVLDQLPPDLPSCPAGYIEATGVALRDAGRREAA